jgi:hypothetical protein
VAVIPARHGGRRAATASFQVVQGVDLTSHFPITGKQRLVIPFDTDGAADTQATTVAFNLVELIHRVGHDRRKKCL